ncbi:MULTISPECIES: hypothetical protein [unclassified Acinetobacter]|uniref:hypothetical protein n=1 Tax=unclassified Acinetobacter TaxID=196816 RepID=UPI0029352F39|nr:MULTISPECIES: hypothetical protein [unclassified Acinetobacter]WOE32907.1 hypothetical protein QSG84_07040 [Acinetobacter sp. SAAs470]WOE38384.1 hypothetical protein QSG86_16095 [Acinetobacter sp. SAAs474]
MYKLMILLPSFLLAACSTNSNLAPVNPIYKADISDLNSMSDCKVIQENIEQSQTALAHYKKSKSLNTSANVLSGIASVLSLGTDTADYVSNTDLNNGILSYENRLKQLEVLKTKYCDLPVQ